MYRRFLVLLIALSLALSTVGSSAAAAPELQREPSSDSFVGVHRITGATRFAVAAAAAKTAFPNWVGVKHVIIACGDDQAAADPLAAGGLGWAYGAPLLLTSRYATPGDLTAALKSIKAVNGNIEVHVVGGPVSVPPARISDISRIVGASHVERLPYGDRYETARQMSLRMKTVAAQRGATMTPAAILANGSNPAAFYDALAASAACAHVGIPLFLVQPNGASAGVLATLRSWRPASIIAVGGTLPAGTARAVAAKAGITARCTDLRGVGPYATANSFATFAVGSGWLTTDSVGVAAKLPDGMTGGSAIGRLGGPILYTAAAETPYPTANWLIKRQPVAHTYVFGGTASVPDAQLRELRTYVDPATPWTPRISTYRSYYRGQYLNMWKYDLWVGDQGDRPLDANVPFTADFTTKWDYPQAPKYPAVTKTDRKSGTVYAYVGNAPTASDQNVPNNARVLVRTVRFTTVFKGKTYTCSTTP